MTEEPGGPQSMGSLWVRHNWAISLTFHFHALEKEMATHSSVLAWRIPGMGEPGGLPSLGSHRVGHDWSDSAAAAAHSSIVHCNQCPSTDEWINKMGYINTMICYSILKMKEILIHATTWMNLKDIMLSEISQSQKDNYCMIILIWDTRRLKLIKRESKMNGDYQRLGEKEMGYNCLIDTKLQLEKNKTVQEIGVIIAHYEYIKCHRIIHLVWLKFLLK